MIALLALRQLTHRPWRSLLLLIGFGLGAGVMIVLLAIGQAMLEQARDTALVGGGEITVLPEGMNLEVMKTGGVGGLFFSIDHARFIDRQLLDAPRLAGAVRAVAPQIVAKLVYLRTRTGEYAVQASGDIPSRSAAVGALPRATAGEWVDDAGDRRWVAPSRYELYSDMDHFHLPPPGIADAASWGEWHYFNVLAPDARHWAFISLMVGGDIRGGDWGGRVTVTLRTKGGATRRFAAESPPGAVHLSTESPDLRIGTSSVALLNDGRYHVQARATEAGTGAPVLVDLVVTAAPRAWFPGAMLSSGAFTSGYVVPALRAEASGRICVRKRCTTYASAQSYHDHNWGVWRDVRWEWGEARAGAFTVLFGRVEPPDSSAARTPLFLYLVDSLGFRAVFRPQRIEYADTRVITVNGVRVRVPRSAVLAAVRGDDTLRVTLDIQDAIGTDMRGTMLRRGARSAVRDPYFIQMQGRATLDGWIGGARVHGEGNGFFETYRAAEP